MRAPALLPLVMHAIALLPLGRCAITLFPLGVCVTTLFPLVMRTITLLPLGKCAITFFPLGACVTTLFPLVMRTITLLPLGKCAITFIPLVLCAGCAASVAGTPDSEGARANGPSAAPKITLEIAPGELVLAPERLQRWVDESQAILRETFGTFPVAELQLTIRPRGGSRGIHDGTTWPRGHLAAIEVGVGAAAGERALERDWVLVHEMIHLAVPSLPPAQHWFEEGLATYLEPFARARGGRRSESEVWRELTRDYGQGQPRAGEGGLDDTRTWARTYYGGALFCLVADVGIARATHGAKSLRNAFAGTLARGRNILTQADLAAFARELDRAVGVEVVAPLYERWAHTPVVVDLDALWRELGLVREANAVRFDESAPLAGWRASLVVASVIAPPR